MNDVVCVSSLKNYLSLLFSNKTHVRNVKKCHTSFLNIQVTAPCFAASIAICIAVFRMLSTLIQISLEKVFTSIYLIQSCIGAIQVFVSSNQRFISIARCKQGKEKMEQVYTVFKVWKNIHRNLVTNQFVSFSALLFSTLPYSTETKNNMFWV